MSRVGGCVLERQVERLARHGDADLSGWQCTLRALWHFHRSNHEDNAIARRHALAALRRDPAQDMARYLLVLTYQHDIMQQWSKDLAASRREMRRAAHEFELRSPGNTWMYIATSYASVALGDRDEALERLEAALELAPNVYASHSLYGQVLAMAGCPEQGLHELRLARRLSPRDPRLWTILLTTSLAHFVAGRYHDAVEWAEYAVRDRPHVPYCHAALAVAHAHCGNVKLASEALHKAIARNPTLEMRGFVPGMSATKPEIAARFMEGLRIAGMPAP